MDTHSTHMGTRVHTYVVCPHKSHHLPRLVSCVSLGKTLTFLQPSIPGLPHPCGGVARCRLPGLLQDLERQPRYCEGSWRDDCKMIIGRNSPEETLPIAEGSLCVQSWFGGLGRVTASKDKARNCANEGTMGGLCARPVNSVTEYWGMSQTALLIPQTDRDQKLSQVWGGDGISHRTQ